jgi:hypothetical protein
VKILDRLPYSSDPMFVPAPGESVRVKPYQIVVTVSVSPRELLLTRNRLYTAIDPERLRVSLRTPDWGTKVLRLFGRWL